MGRGVSPLPQYNFINEDLNGIIFRKYGKNRRLCEKVGEVGVGGKKNTEKEVISFPKQGNVKDHILYLCNPIYLNINSVFDR